MPAVAADRPPLPFTFGAPLLAMSEMPQELRVGFRRELANMEKLVEQLFGYVVEGIPGATDALLTGDAGSVRALHEREKVIDAVWQGLEAKVNELLLREAPVASDLRYLLTVVRVVPELERSGDLAQHIAIRGTKGLADQLSPRASGSRDADGRRRRRDGGATWPWCGRPASSRRSTTSTTSTRSSTSCTPASWLRWRRPPPSTSVAMEMALVAALLRAPR